MQNVRVNNKIFNSISKAAKFIGIQRSNLSAMLKDKKATTYKDLMIEKLDSPEKKKTAGGRKIPVLVDGVACNSIADAEKLCGFPVNTLAKPLRKGIKIYKGHTIEYVLPSQKDKYKSTKAVKVLCVTTGVIYDKLCDAAKAAGAYQWTMSKKMEASGGYIDKNGNEYVRLSPMVSKNTYKDTGKTLKKIRKHVKMPSRRGVKLNIKETFAPIDTALQPVKSTKELLSNNADAKTQVPQVVKDAINDKIIKLLKDNGIYEQIIDLLNFGGFSSIKIKND